ncbi:MAG: RNA pseudouridine synthase, partial [Verrucomicrobiota bacterium]
LISRVRLHLGGKGTAHLVNRLDRETSGIVMAAKNSEAAGELGKIWESRAVQKIYLTIVHGEIREKAGLIDASLGKDEQSQIAIKDCVRADGAAAQTEFRLLKNFSRDGKDFSLVQVRPRTGRKHQIRIHLAHIGHAIVGDKLYGGDEDLYLALVQERLTEEQRRKLILTNQALHAGEISLPWRGRDLKFSVEPEGEFLEFAAVKSI